MAITASQVKELRSRTGAGMMDCKKALTEANGNMEAAIDYLRENGIAKAAKKAGRIAAEGTTYLLCDNNKALILEINSETDFVAKNQLFLDFAKLLEEELPKVNFSNIEDLLEQKINGKTIEEYTTDLTAKIGEKIHLRRALKYEAKEDEVVAGYTHANNRIATILIAKGHNQEALRHVAMHIAALNPAHLFETCLDEEELKEIYERINNDPKLASKPEKIQVSMKSGMLRKEFNERGVLMYQPFVMEESKTVQQYLTENKLQLIDATRFEVGEGIEKKTVDFATEVAEQMSLK